jgi:hypothetical protein
MPKKKSSGLLAILFLGLIIAAVIAVYRTSEPGHNSSGGVDSEGTSRVSLPRLGPAEIYPDQNRTPGATNPAITQENIHENICNRDWSTKSIRPPAHYTNTLKLEQIREYGHEDDRLRDYEEDHLIPLELGGSPDDSRNLWPEPYDTSIPDGGAKAKDRVESFLHKQVCSGRISLGDAQLEIVNDWYRVYESLPAE